MHEQLDAEAAAVGHEQHPHAVVRGGGREHRPAALLAAFDFDTHRAQFPVIALRAILRVLPVEPGDDQHCDARHQHRDPPAERRADRSEEHTSELQSLMRISYAVFCLKKKTMTTRTRDTTNETP